MPTLTIDERPIEVPDGTTVLEAARRLGIAIPTLCHHPDLRAQTSCYVCVVKVRGRRGLVPSCATVVEDGMVVTSEAAEVRDARQAALELLLSDHAGDCVAPCTGACPAGLEVSDFLYHLRDGRQEQAIHMVRRRLPLPASLGRVCPAYCERVCRRAEREGEAAIAIRSLHRHAAEVDLAEAEKGDAALFCEAPSERKKGTQLFSAERTSSGSVKKRAASPFSTCGEKSCVPFFRVAIVGAGPAGLSAAWYLRLRGHACTVLDERPEPGGMYRYGLPEFRLPSEALAAEVALIRRAGVTFRMNWRLGRDRTLDALQREHDAVFLALGATADVRPDWLRTDRAVLARPFLMSARQEQPPTVTGRVVVVGDDEIAADAARLALRLGAGKVTCLWTREGEKTSKWTRSHLASAEAEGVRFRFGVTPIEVADTSDDRPRVRFREGGAEQELDAETVIVAAGRTVDRDLLEMLGLAATRRGIEVDRNTLATGRAGVFAGGDVVSGPAYGVQAVAAGRRAAEAIDQYLVGQPDQPMPHLINSRLGALSDEEQAVQFRDADPAARAQAKDLTPDQAQTEAQRCLQCDCRKRDACRLRLEASRCEARPSRYRGERRPFDREVTHPDIVYEPGKCIQCALCIQVAEQAREPWGLAMIDRGFRVQPAVPFGHGWVEGLRETARRCAEVCPTGAIALRQRATASEPT